MLLSEDANSLYLLGNTNNATTYLLKTDLQGDTIWTKHFYNLNGHALIEKEDSIYLLAAPPSGGNGGYDVALMKMASDGSTTNCYEYDFVDFFYNPYSMVITPYGEGVSSIPYHYDVSINHNSINYNNCIKCISADFSYEVDNLEVSFTNESTLEVDYDWDFGDNNSDNNYNTSHQFSSLGSYEVCLIASDSCSSETICQTIEITECQTEQSNAIITTCDSTYGWNGENYTQSGQYVWNTINSNGCDSIATLNLTVSDLSITAELIDPNCYDSEDGAIDITYESNAMPVDINWSNGLMFEDNLNIAAGEYSVTITDSNDCEQTETFTLTSPQELYLALNAIDASCDYTLDGMIESDVLGGTSPYQYSWSTGSTEEILTEVGTGDYSLTVIDDKDCEASADATVYYLGEGCLEIPTVFTPNDDGYNDDWVINGIIDYPNCSMKIFNRWGQLLFESVGYTQTWNGTYDGDALPIADYYFILDLQDGTEARTGTITLKR
jgi:gliding motility-associated-like protein